uniref:Si:ch211-154o6.3 n=1 Tax=Cyprinus carpio carpio TaxID=630221 RepID=A0A8C1HW15_CYPCA
DGEVRKLQNKLRQIENLGDPNFQLAELLLQHSGPQQTHGIEVTEQRVVACHPVLKIAREERRENERSDGSQTDGRGETHLPVSPSVEVQEDAEFKSRQQTWEKAKFRLRTLEGHSDIITCVVAVDNLVISGSRDTTVKVWHVPTATEQRNLGGHSGGVTCLSAPPPEYCRRLARAFDLTDRERIVLSGSTDCCVRIWALSSGQCVKSIYTFNAVSSLCFIAEGEGFIVTGSDAGKLQVWSWRSQENCQSVNAHLDAVTTLQVGECHGNRTVLQHVFQKKKGLCLRSKLKCCM